MEQKNPSIPWHDLFNRITTTSLNPLETIIIQAPHYLDAFLKIVESTDTRTIANYGIWRLISSSMSYLSSDAKKLQFEFTAAVTGQRQRVPREKECSEIVKQSLGNAVGSMYIRRYFPPSAKAEAEEMIYNIKGAFLQILDELDWMDSFTKGKAKEKAEGMSVHVGYPQEHLDDLKLTRLYSGYKFKGNDYMGNIRNLVSAAGNLAFGQLKLPVDKKDWVIHGKNAAVNAFYLPLDNSIQFPAGILQNPFFDSNRPRYMNYGTIGWIAGHEVTHGFDDQ
jgi:membrane metallo-endopeptidase-like protein 1